MTDGDSTKAVHTRDQCQYFDMIAENAPVAMIIHTIDGIVKLWNKGAESIFLYTTEETVGNYLGDFIAPPIITNLYPRGGFADWQKLTDRKTVSIPVMNKRHNEFYVQYYSVFDPRTKLISSFYTENKS